MKEDVYNKAQQIKIKISHHAAQSKTLENLINYWEKNNIVINNDSLVCDEETKQLMLTEHTTHIPVIDNKANVQISNLELPIEALRVALDYHKKQKELFEKEFEKL